MTYGTRLFKPAYDHFSRDIPNSSRKRTVKEFHEQLKLNADLRIPAYSTFSQAINHGKGSSRVINDISKAIEAYLREKNVDPSQLILQYENANSSSADNRNSKDLPIPDCLHGAWFLIHYRGKRASRTENIPKLDYRVAVLVYGEDTNSSRYFEIVGNETYWKGSMKVRKDFHFFTADQVHPASFDEMLTIIMHETHANQRSEQYGIITGIVHSKEDHPDRPLLSSCSMLYPIVSDVNFHAPLSDEEFNILKDLCKYESAEIEHVNVEENDTSFEAQRTRSIKKFIERKDIPTNSGDRLYIQR